MINYLGWYYNACRSSLISWVGFLHCSIRSLFWKKSRDYSHIVVLQSGGLGDAVLTLPVIDGLRRRWPRARLTVVAGKLGREVFATFAPGLCLYAPDAENQIIGPETDLILHLRAGVSAALASWKNLSARFLSGLPRHSRLRWAPLTYLGLPVPRSREHQYDTFRRMLRPLGLELPDHPHLEVRREWRESLAAKLRAKGLEGRRLAVVHPFGAWAPRAWPWERWGEICTHLHEELNLGICLVGGPEDVVTLRKYGPAPVPVQVLAGELSLGELAALCEQAALFLGNDSGPAHLAAAAGAPCLVIYGPQEAALFGIRSTQAAVIQGRSSCTPCWQTVCPFDRVRCLDGISVERVRAEIRPAPTLQH